MIEALSVIVLVAAMLGGLAAIITATIAFVVTAFRILRDGRRAND
jgi:hypothetical protein